MRPVEFSELVPRQLGDLLEIYREAFETPWEWPVEKVARLAAPAADDRSTPCRALALLDGEQPVALAIAGYLPGGNLWYLHYFAVERSRRSSGFGSALLRALLPLGEAAAQAAGRPGCLGTLLEVEQVEGPPPDADREQRQRRIAFYRRHGALMTGTLVPRPPWARPEMPDWELLLIPGLAWDGEMNAATRRRLCSSLMVEGYSRSQDEPWLQACLNRLTAGPER